MSVKQAPVLSRQTAHPPHSRQTLSKNHLHRNVALRPRRVITETCTPIIVPEHQPYDHGLERKRCRLPLFMSISSSVTSKSGLAYALHLESLPSFPRGSVFSDTITQTSKLPCRNSDTGDVESAARFPRTRGHEAAIRSLREPRCSSIPLPRFRIRGQGPFVGDLGVVTRNSFSASA